MQKLLRFLKPYVPYLIFGPLFKLLEAIFELIVPAVMAKIIDNGIGGHDITYIWKMIGVIVVLGMCGLGFALTCQYLAARCAFGYGTDLRAALFRHIQTLSQTELDKLGSSTLINRITNDVTASQSGVNMFIRLASRAPFLVVGAIVMALLIDWQLSLIFLIIAPIVGFLLYFVMHRTIPMYGANQKRLDRIARRTGENLDGVRVIRAFARQKQEDERFAEDCAELERSMLAAGRISAVLNPLTFLILNLGIVAVLWFGGGHVDTGRLSQGDLTAFANYMTQILLAMVQLANLIQILTKAQASSLRIAEVLETRSSMQDGTEMPDTASEEAICFEHVTFGYPGAGDAALEDISFTLQKGQTLGLIGGTGSGKSTVAALITRSYDPTEGTVRVFGKDVRSYKGTALHRCIGTVPQKAVLFTGTIAENLRWADADADEQTIRAALETAQAAEFVDAMQYGLETHLVQGGRNLSGGQKQRLTIARALTGKPAMLILDDSMSALDYATDAALRKALAERQGMTTVVISQRATSLMHADLILVLEDGRCVGQGTHQELLKTCDVYREIYEASAK
ncbi:MAG: ABC transporter ATP-binding protein/permease [Oscillospiraceae bacterium]|nr:ABC transporter ATP-binding protein/permease [Oscillospiraceae bacterium]